MNYRYKLKKNNIRNAGFTLVEMVVVLALMAILLGITIFGGLAWQDWSRFQHEDSVAEEIFFAAQNQLMELDSSGATERTVIRPLKTGGSYDDEYLLAYFPDISSGADVSRLESIYDSNGEKLTWDNIWEKGALSSSVMGLKNANLTDEKSILKIRANAGDYDTYLAYKRATKSVKDSMLGTDISEGTVLLFDLIAPYITDTSVLGGAICLEFSPETGQVFSALYSDQAGSLIYDYEVDTAESGAVNICDRQLQVRESLMLGYYGVDKLTEKIRGKGVADSDLRLEIRNDELLTMVLQENKEGVFADDVSFTFVIYNGNSGNLDDEAMRFVIAYKDIPKTNSFEDAQASPISVPVKFSKGIYSNTDSMIFRFPIWIENGEIHIVLDAADVQAQTSVYASARKAENADSEAAARFRNTYSFYRFGLADEVNYIYASVQAGKKVISNDGSEEGVVDFTTVFSQRLGIDPSGTSDHKTIYQNIKDAAGTDGFLACGECVGFASYSQNTPTSEGVTSRSFEISNARHLYNMRYETEFKKSTDFRNTFTLISDIDWDVFTGKKVPESDSQEQAEEVQQTPRNYFFTSYSEEITSGIDYSGYSKVTGGTGVYRAIDQNNNTQNYPFPSFRCLGMGDVFTQAKPYGESGGYYTISNLTISLAANVVYGVYDDSLADDVKIMSGTTVLYDAMDHLTDQGSEVQSVKDLCLHGDFSGLLGLNSTKNDSSGSNLARGGALPLGLFCENLGTITNITLDKHIVRGIEPIVSPENASSDQLVSTNMVGGFAGNNAGYVANLTLLNTADPNGSDNSTMISGRTDVGGIIGRESYVVPDQEAANRIAALIASAEGETDESEGSVDTIDPRDITIFGMKNFGTVTGMENIGGIVGRVYTHFVGDNARGHNYASFTQFSSGNGEASSDETELRRYRYYHDGYFITDSKKSMTQVTVQRADEIVLRNCSNRGVVAGDDAYYSVQSYSSYNQIATKCAFIGGIAGITMDGFIFDDLDLNIGSVNSKSADNAPIRLYVAEGFFNSSGFSYVTMKNCDSIMSYDPKTFATGETFNTQLDLMNSIHNLSRDYYVGGLVGYARLTSFENCYTKPTEVMNDEGASGSYVLGAGYVGGLAGCSDYSKFNHGELISDDLSVDGNVSDRKYYAINYNNVIGRAYVGGIAGAFGIGCSDQGNMDFRNPSMNQSEDGMSPSCAYGEKSDNRIVTGRYLLNKGATLTLNNKNYAWFESDECRYDRMSPVDENWLVESSGGCGGIAGAACSAIADCDSIQTEGTKKLVSRLVTGDEDVDLYSLDTPLNSILEYREKSLYGGNAVGGVVGVTLGGGTINPKSQASNSKSMIDAVVYGRDRVGGAVGVNLTSDCSNFYPSLGTSESKGLLVVGEDMIGGLYGDLRAYAFNEDSITSQFTLRGRYAVGGLIGEINTDTRQNRTANDWKVIKDVRVDIPDNNPNAKIVIDGIACVGGCIGLSDDHDVYCEGSNDSNYLMKGIAISDMDVHGKYFAGGIYGALLHDALNVSGSSSQNKLNETANRRACDIHIDGTVSVYADAFAGGMVGFYNYYSNYTRLQGEYGDTETNGSVHTLIQLLKSENDPYGNYRKAFQSIVEGDNTDSDFINNTTSEILVNFSDYTTNEMLGNQDSVSVSSNVEAGIFAGGLAGYIPNGMNIKISGFVNGANIRTTGYVGGNGGDPSVSESYDTDAKYSYLGGVIGRVPSGMKLENCVNKVSGIYPASSVTAPEDGYYYATNATYLGGLTEVNAGVIAGTRKPDGPEAADNYTVKTSYINYLKNTTVYDYSVAESIEGVGAFAGVNGTKHTDGETSGVIEYCSNQEMIKAKKVAGIAAVIGGPSEIRYCENNGALTSSDTTNGIVAGISTGVMSGMNQNSTISTVDSLVNNIKITSCVNLADINLPDANGQKTTHSAGIVYNTNSCGKIELCRNYGVGANYGISAFEAATVSKNLEASGLNEKEGTKKPIAPMSSAGLEKNFYISAVGDEEEEEEDDTSQGWIIPKITKENKGNVYFVVNVNGNERNEVYNRTEDERRSMELFYMSKNKGQQELTVEYNLITDEHEGVFMKNFSIVWGGKDWATYATYVYDVKFDYIDSDGEKRSVTYRRSVTDNTPSMVIDKIPTPSDEVRITKITVYSNINCEEYQNVSSINWQYNYAYWTDAYPVHYINDVAHKENMVGFVDDIYFYATCKYNSMNAPSEYADIYNGSSKGNTKKIYNGFGSGDYNSYHEFDISVQSPNEGIRAEKLRVYYHTTGNDFASSNGEARVSYSVKIGYIDDQGADQELTMDRDIHVNGQNGAYDFYDEIPILTSDGYNVYTNNIQIILDNRNGNKSGDLYYYALVWVDEDGNEWPIADKRNKYTLSDTDRATTLNPNFIKAENRAATQTVKKNHWPIRLSYDHATSSIVYYKNDTKRSAFSDVINDPTSEAYYSDYNQRIVVYNELDARFIQFAKSCVASDFVP